MYIFTKNLDIKQNEIFITILPLCFFFCLQVFFFFFFARNIIPRNISILHSLVYTSLPLQLLANFIWMLLHHHTGSITIIYISTAVGCHLDYSQLMFIDFFWCQILFYTTAAPSMKYYSRIITGFLLLLFLILTSALTFCCFFT